MESLLLLSRLFLVGIFGVAGITKLMDLKGSETAVRDFGVPKALVTPLSIILSVSEVIIAILLFPLFTSWIAAVAALVFLIWFTIGMGYQMAKGNAPDCHCFGQLYNEPVRVSSLIRNAGFSIPAIFLVYRGVKGQGPGFGDERTYSPEFVFGVLILAGVASLLLYARQMSIRQIEILRRMEILEALGGGAIERNEAGDPNDGLPIGAVFPDFSLLDAQGKLITLDHLLAEAKPTLFFFISPTCEPCKALMPEIDEWQAGLRDSVNLVFVSKGTVEANQEKFTGSWAKRFLLQKNTELQDLVSAKWTPSALLMNTDGRVASHIAAGDVSIRGLVDTIKSGDINDPFFYFASKKPHAREPRIGETVPDFEMPDLEGRMIDAAELRGKPTLVTFWSLTCPHCVEMMRQIKNWESDGGEREANLLLFSDGEIEEHRKFELSSRIIIDKDYATAAKFGMMGTPSAVLVDENGRIASETAVGAANIWALIGKWN
ncbi:MAG: TlpA family protein disulfide reductase [Acidobacteriota bacterium]